MNERIKELYSQAGLTMNNPFVYEQWYLDALEKFAELIVIEMCGMMGQAEDDLYSLEPSERPTEYIEWLRNWQERFTKHFGVEE